MNRQLRERLKCERTEAQDQQPPGRETGRPAEPASGLAPERSCGASPGIPRARPSEAGHLLSLAPALASFSTGMAFPILNDNEEKRLLLSGQGLASQWCKSWFKSKPKSKGRDGRLGSRRRRIHPASAAFRSIQGEAPPRW